MMICKKCGTENADDQPLCKVCGSALGEKRSNEKNDKKDDLYDKFTYADVQAAVESSRRKDSGSNEDSFTPRSRSRKSAKSALPVMGRFLKKHWKWLLPAVAVLLVLIIIISAIASIKPDHGLLAISPEYVQYSLAGETAEGAIPLVGLMGNDGDVLLGAEYQSVLGEIEEDIFAVIGSNAKIGAVNRKGKKVIDFEFLSADTEIGFSDGLWAVETADGWGYVDKKGRTKIGFEFAGARAFSDGLAAVFNGEKWGYINKKGNLEIEYEYEDAAPFDGGLARICKDGLYGFIDDKGEIVIEPQFTAAFPYFQDGLCLVKVGNRYGFIDEKGEYAINPQFDDALPFSEGLAAVRLEDKVGYINKNGKYVIDAKYEGTLTAESMFYEGYAVVYEDDTAIVIDKKGKAFVSKKFRCSYISHLHDGFFVVRADDKYGIISADSGDYVLEGAYDELVLTMRDAAVFAGAKEGVSVFVNADGEVIAEVGSQIKSTYFMSSVTPKTVAVANWCSAGDR